MSASREERARLVRRLYDESPLPPRMRRAFIVEQTGLSTSYVYELLDDPEGHAVAARKAARNGRCLDCGGPTKNGGAKVAPERCRACRTAFVEANKRWTPETIVRAVRVWGERYGRPPTAGEWVKAGVDHPACSTVTRVMGWANALFGAGFTPRWQGTGSKPHLTREVLEETIDAYERAGSLVGAAELLGITPAGVELRLRKAGYATNRTKGRRMSRLKPEDVVEREISRLSKTKTQYEAEIESLDRDLAKWEAVRIAVGSVADGQGSGSALRRAA